jgi:hypothetical protein
MILSPLLLRVTTNLAISCIWPIYFY